MRLKTCDECGGKFKEKDVVWNLAGKNMGAFPALVCQKCGQTLFDIEIVSKMENLAKQKGLWGFGRKHIHSETEV